MRSVGAVDAKTVRVVLRSRYSNWRSLFGNVLPAHALRGEDLTKIWSDRIDNPKTGRPIGSGPFLLESWEPGRQLTLVRNPRYWGAHRSYLDRIVIRFRVESENPVDWFRNDELDVARAIFLPGSISALRGEAGVKVLAGPSAGYQGLNFRIGPGGHPALRSKLIRRALAYGIDRATLVREVPGQIDPNLRPLQSILFLVQSPHYRPHWSSYRYRPARATRLLEQAGCRRGADSIYSCAGERLSLRFVTSAGNPNRARILSLVQAQLRRSGVEVVPIFAPPATFLFTILPSGDFDVALFGFFSAPNPTGNTIFGCGGSQNFTGYCQRLVTRDLDQADRILDARQQARVMNRADAQMARDMPVLPLFQIPLATAVRDTVQELRLQSLNPPDELGELVARGVALAAAIAVSLLAVSGAGGSGTQTPRVGGTIVFGELPEPVCLNPLLARCLQAGGPPTLLFLEEKVLEPAFVVSPRLHVAATARLRRHVHEEAAVHAHVPDSASGEVERRRARHGPRLRLHAPRQDRPQGRAVRGGAGASRAGAECLRRRREGRSSRPARPTCGLAHPLREHPAAARARGREARKHLGRRNRQSEDGQADRERAFPHRALGARRTADSRAQPPLLGPPRVSRPARRPLPSRQGRSRWNGSGEASSTSPGAFPLPLLPWPRYVRSGASGSSARPVRRGSTSRSGSVPEAIRR